MKQGPTGPMEEKTMTKSIGKWIMASCATGALVFALVLPSPASAQRPVNRGNLNQIQRSQQKQIRQGVQNGSLTKQQAAHLGKGEQKIHATEMKDMKDGSMTPQEAGQLKREAGREEQAIQKAEGNNTPKP